MSNHESTYVPKTRIEKWFDERLPLPRMMHGQFVDFPTPRNLNYMWTFGGILTFMLVAQIVSGLVLSMHYVPSDKMAFDSVEAIRRDVNYGWLLRNVHAVGASMFFLAVYLHIARGLYYGSYKAPREILWILGVIIFLLMMAAGFMGYTLVWGQMSFWGVTVITNLFSAIPIVGDSIVKWLWGGFAVSGVTLNRFFSLHFLLPFVIAGVVALHIWALHHVGQNNPTGIEIKTKSDSVPMAPYAVMKDLFAMIVFMMFSTHGSCSSRRTISGTRTTTSKRTRFRRRLTSFLNGTSCRSTRSCARSRRSLAVCLAMFAAIRGFGVHSLARYEPREERLSIARCSRSSSGCSSSRLSRLAIWVGSRLKGHT